MTGAAQLVKYIMSLPRIGSLIILKGLMLAVSRSLGFLVIIARPTQERVDNIITLGTAAPSTTVYSTRSQDTLSEVTRLTPVISEMNLALPRPRRTWMDV